VLGDWASEELREIEKALAGIKLIRPQNELALQILYLVQG